jgi:hypothetical protein
MRRLDDFVDLRPRERIVNVFTLASGFDEILGSQPRQLLRDCRLPAPNQLPKFGHGFLAFDQKTQDDQAGFVGQGLEKVGRVPRIGEHGRLDGRTFTALRLASATRSTDIEVLLDQGLGSWNEGE